MRQYSPPRVDNLAPWPVKSWLLSVVSEGCQVSSKAANGRKLGVHRGLCLARVGHLRNTLKAASWKRLATHSVAEAQHICRQGFATYPLEGCQPSSCSLWQRAAKVPAAHSSPAARRRGDTRVAWARSKRLSSRSSERATVGTLAARSQSACGPFVCGGTRRGDTRVAWARSRRLSSRGAKGLRSALWQRAAKVPAARSSPAARAEATRVSHERGVNGFPLAPAKGLRSALWPRAAEVPAARSSPAARAEATRVSHGHGADGFPLAPAKGRQSANAPRAAQVRAARSSPAARRRGDTRVASARRKRLSSRGDRNQLQEGKPMRISGRHSRG